MNLKEVINGLKDIIANHIGSFADVEFYKDKFEKRIGFHTDRIEYIDEFTGDEEIVEWELMDEELYNNTILANCDSRFTDFYDSEDKILVIKVK